MFSTLQKLDSMIQELAQSSVGNDARIAECLKEIERVLDEVLIGLFRAGIHP